MGLNLLIAAASLALAGLFGYFLLDLIWNKTKIANSKIDYGRKFASYGAFVSTISSAHFFFQNDFLLAALKTIIAIIVFTMVAFVLGLIYAFTKSLQIDREINDSKTIQNESTTKPSVETDKKSELIRNEDEDKFWEMALMEYDGKERNNGLWARLFTQYHGDEKKIKIAYIEERAKRLINERNINLKS